RGINQERLMLMPYVKDYREHLNIYNLIDISLDCYPYNGTTTTFESLLMGVPVVTLSGNSHVSRVGLSILSNLKMEGFIAKSEEEFLNIISDIGSTPEKIANIRMNLRNLLLNSSLTDKKGFTKDLERLLLEIIFNQKNKRK
ncbi:MAG: hypothetical protein N2738_08965, partial [Thermodesulfovibrionales bacterium]|nr:hypothetical protein [Thermodesulfovibrionales bacterium]